jgi:hypothetical protein
MKINNGNVTFDVGLPEGIIPGGLQKTIYPKFSHLVRGGGLQAGSLFGSIGDVVRGIPIVGPLLGSFFPSEKKEQEQPQQQGLSATDVAQIASQAASQAVQQTL